MEFIVFIWVILLSALTFLPLVKHQHWFFRIPDFGRLQIIALQLLTLPFLIYILSYSFTSATILLLFFLLASTIYQAIFLFPYINFESKKTATQKKETISILSVNVYQYNQQYQKLIALVNNVKPNIFLTIESNKDWEDALSVLDNEYKYHQKIALENTYGMHFYSNIEVSNLKTHFFVADDIPSIEVHLTTANGNDFVLYGIHPPPATPTEEPNSKEQDGELMSIAKKSSKQNKTTIVVGDFNSVAWSRITKLFAKVSGLKDGRIGRGFISTFPANYPIFRIPIDLVYHSKDINISCLKTLKPIGSDHLPLYIEFFITNKSNSKNNSINSDTLKETNTLIAEGIQETSENR
ncbi:endonuclease/exonuclease/phosphatase family protein [Wenyingzhuangia sp. 2_MG-2023]|uniref:endonuclease/exonuclease/phosphatase family protein n=1 Tax=Wenyingzhuangia sp. 2_MG-2023 TaxID=3062639 RepID=UPI0026E206F2|nr:endonuclease/exonuclease/phosphatase family protein [Wenyingzhuangia sp. 2_MG-2023]MDO6737352.1 endonuclease/exonuclease/phosphatase family protein [Wenyingzhuangia sp. 2_MG-2023]